MLVTKRKEHQAELLSFGVKQHRRVRLMCRCNCHLFKREDLRTWDFCSMFLEDGESHGHVKSRETSGSMVSQERYFEDSKTESVM